MNRNVHVEQNGDGLWNVTGGNIRGRYLFTFRDHALAYSRAIAHSIKVDLYVHQRDGDVVRQPISSLTYPKALD